MKDNYRTSSVWRNKLMKQKKNKTIKQKRFIHRSQHKKWCASDTSDNLSGQPITPIIFISASMKVTRAHPHTHKLDNDDDILIKKKVWRKIPLSRGIKSWLKTGRD